MSILNDIGRNMKDMAVSKGVVPWLNKQMADYGKIVSFKLDSFAKRVELEALLNGEKEPVKVWVEKYAVVQKGVDVFVRFERIETSREWLNTLLRGIVLPKYAPANMVQIPAEYAWLIDKVL